MLEYIDTINCDAQPTKDREVYNGRKLIAKQIKAKCMIKMKTLK